MFFETSPTHLPPFAITSVSASALTNSLNRPLKQTVLFLNMPTVSIRESPFMEELGSHGGDGRSAAALCTLLMEPHRPAPPLPPLPRSRCSRPNLRRHRRQILAGSSCQCTMRP
jgi:hypothetical protein